MNDDVRGEVLRAAGARPRGAPTAAARDAGRRRAPLWLAQREADDGCTLAASRFINDTTGRNRMTTADAWRKARLSIEYNRPKMAAGGAVESSPPEAMPLLAELNASPTRFLHQHDGRLARAARAGRPGADQAGHQRHRESAAAQLEQTNGARSCRRRAQLDLGRDGPAGRAEAGRRRAGATSPRSRATPTSPTTCWPGRCAPRCAPAARPTGPPCWGPSMPCPRTAGRPGLEYWRARALLAGGQEEAPRRGAEAAGGPRIADAGFYEMLALEELGEKITVPARPAAAHRRGEAGDARSNPSLNRALYAIALGLRSEGTREWNYTTNLHHAAAWATATCWPPRSSPANARSGTAASTPASAPGRDRHRPALPDALPRPVVRRSREINLDPAYVYGLIRQESRFIMDARSTRRRVRPDAGDAGHRALDRASIGLNGFRSSS
jgi:soluble lytic murein transglycosylase